MPVLVRCTCGSEYNLKDEYAGKLVQCPRCGQNLLVPSSEEEEEIPLHRGDPPFDRDLYLLRQHVVAISEKYSVCDENNNPILFVERPVYLARGLLAILAGLIVLGLSMGAFAVLGEALNQEWLLAVGLLVGAVLTLIVFLAIIPKRHVTFWRDESRTGKLLEILQDRKFMPIVATYTVRDPSGNILARLRKNILTNLIRRKWSCYRPDGSLWCVAKEDSLILSLLRRLIGPLFGILRTNFIICDPDTDEVLGEFNRKFTLFDRYVLDLRADRDGLLDRRVALALGVMLDTGERR